MNITIYLCVNTNEKFWFNFKIIQLLSNIWFIFCALLVSNCFKIVKNKLRDNRQHVWKISN